MKLSSHFVQTCRRCFERWRQEVWPALLSGLGMVLFSLACFVWTAWEWNSRRRFDIEMVLVALILLPVGLWFSYEALQSCVAHVRDFFSATQKLPAERALVLEYATLSARLRAAASREEGTSWQEGEDFVIWQQGEGRALFAHAVGEGRWLLLFRSGCGNALGIGRLKYWSSEEGLKFPTRFKRVKAEGCVFYHEGRVAVYPAEAVPAFEADVLPYLVAEEKTPAR